MQKKFASMNIFTQFKVRTGGSKPQVSVVSVWEKDKWIHVITQNDEILKKLVTKEYKYSKINTEKWIRNT